MNKAQRIKELKARVAELEKTSGPNMRLKDPKRKLSYQVAVLPPKEDEFILLANFASSQAASSSVRGGAFSVNKFTGLALFKDGVFEFWFQEPKE